MKKILILVSTIIASAMVSGCASIELDHSAQRVIASPNPAPKSCKYVGQVTGNQGNFFTGAWTSNKNLEQGAMNDMKNEAAKLGANYIQLVTNRAGNTGSLSSYNGNISGGMEQTNVTNLGNAYRCPGAAIGL